MFSGVFFFRIHYKYIFFIFYTLINYCRARKFSSKSLPDSCTKEEQNLGTLNTRIYPTKGIPPARIKTNITVLYYLISSLSIHCQYHLPAVTTMQKHWSKPGNHTLESQLAKTQVYIHLTLELQLAKTPVYV